MIMLMFSGINDTIYNVHEILLELVIYRLRGNKKMCKDLNTNNTMKRDEL